MGNIQQVQKVRQAQRGPLLEYSVVYTDRAVNLMSQPFQQVMIKLSEILKNTYHAQHLAIIPGSGTFAMEAVARTFANNKNVLVIRNGFFSYRWSEIFQIGNIPAKEIVLKADHDKREDFPQFSPVDIQAAVESIQTNKPDVVLAPQVETATGIILPNEYIKKIGEAVHSYGGLFVLDAIAAGTLFVDMESVDVDVLISAPQKGWSSPACCGIVMLNQKAYDIATATQSTSFSLNLAKWLEVMKKYEGGAFMYYTTLPTDALTIFRDNAEETVSFGLDTCDDSARKLGKAVRELLEKNGFKSVASPEFASPTVIVVYASKALLDAGKNSIDIVNRFKNLGIQVAAGVPFKCDESERLSGMTFRIGLFGLDKLKNVEKTVNALKDALQKI